VRDQYFACVDQAVAHGRTPANECKPQRVAFEHECPKSWVSDSPPTFSLLSGPLSRSGTAFAMFQLSPLFSHSHVKLAESEHRGFGWSGGGRAHAAVFRHARRIPSPGSYGEQHRRHEIVRVVHRSRATHSLSPPCQNPPRAIRPFLSLPPRRTRGVCRWRTSSDGATSGFVCSAR
jgi:hypothetical protein